MGEQVRDIDPGLAVFLEGALGSEELGVRFDELIFGFAELRRARLAAELIEQRFGIECLDVARPPGHEQEDDRFGLGLFVRLLWGKRVDSGGAGPVGRGHLKAGERTESAEGVFEEFAAVACPADVFWH